MNNGIFFSSTDLECRQNGLRVHRILPLILKPLYWTFSTLILLGLGALYRIRYLESVGVLHSLTLSNSIYRWFGL